MIFDLPGWGLSNSAQNFLGFKSCVWGWRSRVCIRQFGVWGVSFGVWGLHIGVWALRLGFGVCDFWFQAFKLAAGVWVCWQGVCAHDIGVKGTHFSVSDLQLGVWG